MKRLLHILFAVLISSAAFSQPGEWVWIHGNNVANGAANYGLQGIPSPSNMPPAVYEPCEWRDAAGNFWLYGGFNGVFYADLWKYDVTTNEWTWMKGPGTTNYGGSYGIQGVASPLNSPPGKSYCSTTWTDLNGNLWLFAGLSITGQSSSDLWMFDISANEWTWVNGSNTTGQAAVYGIQGVPSVSNNPGDRWECASSWVDNAGDLWLMGGYTLAGTLNDLWRYHIATAEWTWMNGADFPGGAGVWGTLQIEDPANVPSSRATYTHWTDGGGNFWCFGGYEFGSSINLNDMWRYNPSTNNWTWMNGSSVGNALGVYGTQCVADSLNTPGGRYESRCVWTDQMGNFWLLGGRTCCSASEMWNDLWTYCPVTYKWTWVSGSNFVNPVGSWGTLGVSSPANHPNSRAGAVSWGDNSGHFYLFGGSTSPYPTPFNDLWKFTIDYSCVTCNVTPNAIFTAPNHICPGTCTDFINLSTNATSFEWTFQGASPSSSVDVSPVNICYANPGTYDVTLIATSASGSDTLFLPNYITVYPYPAPQGITQSGDTLFANGGAVSYQWYHNGLIIPGATDSLYVALVSGNYNVVATDVNGCEVEAVIFDVIAQIQSAVGISQLTVFPNPADETLTVTCHQLKGATVLIAIYNAIGEKVMTVQPATIGQQTGAAIDVSYLSQGLYWIELKSGNQTFRTRFMKE